MRSAGCKVALIVLVELASGAELTYPAELRARATPHVLTFSADVPFGSYGFNTRGINGGIPGPTLRMSPGETMKLTLVNNLLAANNKACTTTGTEFCEASVTNLHTHGLHVSSKGISDGLSAESDNIFAYTNPGGGSTPYSFTIPADHMGGTHWYHPHHHHATALQAGGGLAGAYIVDDPVGYLPTEYSSMPEKVLFLSAHNLNTLQTIAGNSQSTIWAGAVATATTANLDTLAFMVNGQEGPTISMGSHTWYRFRMVFAAVETSLVLSFTGAATCTMKLLAKDGVYLNSFPRDISIIYLSPGNRADVAVSCTCTTYPCDGTLESDSQGGGGGGGGPGGRRLQRMGGGGPGPGEAGGDAVTVSLLTVTITETVGASTSALPVTTVDRPCYMQDLQSLNVPGGNTGNLNLNGGGRVVQWNNQGTSMTYANTHANGASMSDWPPLTTFTTGNIYQIAISGANAHPFHLHVNPYQITGFSAGTSYGGGYWQVGDWHDTLMIAEMGGGSSITVRTLTDTFTGKMVIHCHILEHEDEGMMAYIEVGGSEGATYSGASTCYTGSWTGGTTTTNTGTTTTAITTTATTTTATTNTATATTSTATAKKATTSTSKASAAQETNGAVATRASCALVMLMLLGSLAPL